MDRRNFLKAAGLLTGAAALSNNIFGKDLMSSLTGKGNRPNIIFILADDLGIGNLSCYGSDNFHTPNIDKLASEGVRFTHAYTAPLCGPSRACILTGRYGFRTGAVNQDMTGEIKPENEEFIPAILKKAGYISSSVGKWGQLPLSPDDFGFDDYLTFKGSGAYWNSQKNAWTYIVNGTKVPLKDNEYLPDVMHNHLIKFITKHKNVPFFVYYSLSHIHGQILPTPDTKPDTSDLYTDNILYMDKLIGKLTYELDDLGIRKNTLIVFVGDNGTAKPYADSATIAGKKISGQKGSMLEGGALVPMIVNMPDSVPEGKVSDFLVDSTDFVPTFSEIACADLPERKVIDGKSFANLLDGKISGTREWIFIELGNQWYVRNKSFKLTQKRDLFDMRNAPFEERIVEQSNENNHSKEVREYLNSILDKLSPETGILDRGDGSGRHKNKVKK